MQKAEQGLQFSFGRKYRLTSKKDFQSVFAKPVKVTHKYLLALYQFNHLPHARLGILISKHVVKRAVDRNGVRRIIRESFRHHKQALKGLDIVVMLRSKCSASEKKALRDDIDKLWQSLTKSLPTV